MFDAKTIRAAIAADLIAFVSLAGMALFLGFDLVPGLIAGAVGGTVCAAIVLGAAARARSLGTDTPRDRQPTAPAPRFPGGPEPRTTDEDHRG